MESAHSARVFSLCPGKYVSYMRTLFNPEFILQFLTVSNGNSPGKETEAFMKKMRKYLVWGAWLIAFIPGVVFGVDSPVQIFDTGNVSYGTIPPIQDVEDLMYNRKESPALSPDGRQMAFLGPQSINIYVVPSAGGTPVQLFKIPQSEVASTTISTIIRDLCFTPDGQEVSFCKYSFDSKTGIYQALTIEAVNTATQAHRIIRENGYSPCWSSDGRYLFFVNADLRVYTDPTTAEHNGAPAILDTRTGTVRYLTDENFTEKSAYGPVAFPYGGATFSPDGSQIVVSKRISGTSQLVQIPVEGGVPQEITFYTNLPTFQNLPGRVSDPQYSPDGKWLMFSINGNIVIKNMATGAVSNLFTGKSFVECIPLIETPLFQIDWQYGAHWSSDGKRIIYNTHVIYDQLTDIIPVGAKKGASNTYITLYEFNSQTFGTPVSVETEQPMVFDLKGNYPNPFNPSTTISFTLPKTEKVQMDVFNAAGQKIETLVNSYLSAGSHSVTWNAARFSAGVYFYTVKSGDFYGTKKMTLLK